MVDNILTPQQIEGIKQHDLKRSELVKIIHEKYEAKKRIQQESFKQTKSRKSNQA
jgi:hypothetical protein